jgi:glutamine amidotransferase PdxT
MRRRLIVRPDDDQRRRQRCASVAAPARMVHASLNGEIMSKTYTGHLSQKRLNAMFHATKRTKLGRQVNKFLKEHSGGRFGAQPELPLVVIRDAAVPVSPAPERLKAFIRAVFASIRRRVVSSAWPRSRPL